MIANSTSRNKRFECITASLTAVLLVGCEATTPAAIPQSSTAGAGNADKLLIVDCLLPGQIRKLGTSATYLTPRRPIKTSAGDCEIRGGEYVAYDRANYATSLKIWLPQAQAGDAQAQVYVGEIYEKGLGIVPDYALAAQWYQKAADQGNSRAQINLGALYEQGLGVPQNRLTAINLYRKASGLTSDQVAFSSSIQELKTQRQAADQEVTLRRQEADRLRRELERNRNQLAQERQRLEQSRQELQRTRETLQQQRSAPSSRTAAPAVVAAAPVNRELEAQIAQQRSQIQEQQERMAFLQQESERQNARLTAELRAAKLREQELQQAVAAQSQEKSFLEQQVKDLQQQVANSKNALETRKQELEQQQQSLEQVKAELERQQSASATPSDSEGVRKLEQQLATKNAELAKTQQQIAALETEVALRQDRLRSTQDREQQLQQEVDAQTREKELLTQQVDLMQQQQVASRDELNEKEQNLAQARAELERERQAAGGQNNEALKKLEQQLAAKTAELEKTQSKVTSLESEVALRQGELNKLAVRGGGSGAEAVGGPAIPKAINEQMNFGRYYALIIGNNNYAQYPKLQTAVSDAQEVARVLKTRYGFNTRVLTDADRFTMLAALDEFRKSLKEGDNFLLYYAGHGELDNANSRGYWLPVDAAPGSTVNWISNIQVTDILNAMEAKHIMVIADSCYSGTLSRSVTTSVEGGRSPEKKKTWIQLMINTRSRTVLSSGGLAPVYDGGGGNHSIFAKQLLQILQNNQGVLEGPLLYRQVASRVREAARGLGVDQNPLYSPIKFAGDLGAPFFFAPVN